MRGHLAPQPGEIRDRGMGEDQARVGELARELERVAAERGDAAAGVDQHGQPALVCDRDEVADRGLVQREPLGPRMELDPARAGVQRPLGLGDGAVVRVDAAVGDEDAAGFGGGGDHEVVRLAVAGGLVHREDRGARVRPREPGEQLLRRLLVAVGVVLADVGMGVEELERPVGADQGLPPGDGEVVDRVRRRTAHRPAAAAIRSTISSSSCRGGREVEPREALPAGTELGPGAERDPAALAEGRRGIVAEPELAAVEPGEVPGGGPGVADLRQALGEQLREQAPVGVQPRVDGVEPVVALAQGGHRREGAEVAAVAGDLRQPGDLGAGRLAGRDRHGAFQPREVEGLRGGREHDPARGRVGADAEEAGVLGAREGPSARGSRRRAPSRRGPRRSTRRARARRARAPRRSGCAGCRG